MTESQWLVCDSPKKMLALRSGAALIKKQITPPGAVIEAHSLGHLQISSRQLRLFACGCARLAWDALHFDASKLAVSTAERYADGEIAVHNLHLGYRNAVGNSAENSKWYFSDLGWISCASESRAEVNIADFFSSANRDSSKDALFAGILRDVIGNPWRDVHYWQERPVQYDSHFGDDRTCHCGHAYERHFDSYEDMRPVGYKYCQCRRFVETPLWMNPTTLSLAAAAYDQRLSNWNLDPEQLAVLADAIEETGCLGPICRACNGAGTVNKAHEAYYVETIGCPCCEGGRHEPHPLLTHLRGPGPHWRGCWAIDQILCKELHQP